MPARREAGGDARSGARSSALRVCHLGKFYPPASGGIETHLQTLARAQTRLGLKVDVLCVNHRNRAGADVTWRALAATPTVDEDDAAVRLVRLGRWASLARFDCCPALWRRLRRLGPADYDLLHVHVPNPTMLLGLFLARPAVPWVITYHSDVVRQRALLRLQRPIENWVFRRARAVVAGSAAYRRGSSYLARHDAKVTVVPYGIDLEPFVKPAAAALEHAETLRRCHGEPLWLAVGRLVYYKGLDNAVRALGRVPGRLIIVGDGPLRGVLQQLAHAEGVADRIVWYPRLTREELIGAYLAATALWFPSNARSEAFGLVQVEAMACGRPVINSAIPESGVTWVSQDGETGLTVPVDDWRGVAGAATRLWHDRALRERLGRQARERALGEFDADRMAVRMQDVYHEALTTTRNGTARTCASSM
jgi:glycosyltransferase involved in cell wall biosynthesis